MFSFHFHYCLQSTPCKILKILIGEKTCLWRVIMCRFLRWCSFSLSSLLRRFVFIYFYCEITVWKTAILCFYAFPLLLMNYISYFSDLILNSFAHMLVSLFSHSSVHKLKQWYGKISSLSCQ